MLLEEALLVLPELLYVLRALGARDARPLIFSRAISESSSQVCFKRVCSVIALGSSDTGAKCSFMSPQIPFASDILSDNRS